MGYIQELRQLVGNRTLILVGVCVLIFDDRRRILMQRRADNGLWCCPGGMLEIDESAEEAARREVFEETGLLLGDLVLLGVVSGPQMRYRYPNGDDASNVSIQFAARVPANVQAVPCHESRELVWIDVDRIPIDLAPPTSVMLSRFPPRSVYESLPLPSSS
jgi:8-oxo-dGTP pyrophosphatase MutT (NUDIX family)